MEFQIEKVVLWPVRGELDPRPLSFRTNAVNVITGRSQTGKTALIPIIDYCLGASKNGVPIDVIQNSVSWFGVVVLWSGGRSLIARRNEPDSGSTQFYYEEHQLAEGEIQIPHAIDAPNENLDTVKHRLDIIAQMSQLTRGDTGDRENIALTFRTVTHLAFQSHDTISDPKRMFYKVDEYWNAQTLRAWFNYLIGAEPIEYARKLEEVRGKESEYRTKSKAFEKANAVNERWKEDLRGQIAAAKECNLCFQDQPIPDETEVLLRTAQELVANVDTIEPQTVPDELRVANQEAMELENKENALIDKINEAQKRLEDLQKFKGGLDQCDSVTSQKRDRLEIAQWLQTRFQGDEGGVCPFCGASTHPFAQDELSKVVAALHEIEVSVNRNAPFTKAYMREEKLILAEIADLSRQLRMVRNSFAFLRRNDQAAQARKQRIQDVFLLLGQMKSTLELLKTMSESDISFDQLEALQAQIRQLRTEIEAMDVAARSERELEDLCARVQNRLRNLGCDERYKVTAPRFNVKKLNFEVLGDDNEWHLFDGVGSMSNWVAFHIAISCALQEKFSTLTDPPSPVPSFVVFDQPSKAYFPSLDEANDEDRRQVKNMFVTLSESIREADKPWQAIVLEHADETIYGDVENVYTVEKWDADNALIPREWLENSQDNGEVNGPHDVDSE